MFLDPVNELRFIADAQRQILGALLLQFCPQFLDDFIHTGFIQRCERNGIQYVVQEAGTEGILQGAGALGCKEHQVLAVRGEGIHRVLDQTGLVLHQNALVQHIALRKDDLAVAYQRVDHPQEGRESCFEVLEAEHFPSACQSLVQVLQEDLFLSTALVQAHIYRVDFIAQQHLPLIQASDRCTQRSVPAAALRTGNDQYIACLARLRAHDKGTAERDHQLVCLLLSDDSPVDQIHFGFFKDLLVRIDRLMFLRYFRRRYTVVLLQLPAHFLNVALIRTVHTVERTERLQILLLLLQDLAQRIHRSVRTGHGIRQFIRLCLEVLRQRNHFIGCQGFTGAALAENFIHQTFFFFLFSVTVVHCFFSRDSEISIPPVSPSFFSRASSVAISAERSVKWLSLMVGMMVSIASLMEFTVPFSWFTFFS